MAWKPNMVNLSVDIREVTHAHKHCVHLQVLYSSLFILNLDFYNMYCYVYLKFSFVTRNVYEKCMFPRICSHGHKTTHFCIHLLGQRLEHF